MNKLLLTSALVAAFGAAALAPQTARASDGTITFTGSVLSSTCSVGSATGGTVSSGDVSVVLPDVQSSAFTVKGSVAGLTPFTLNLTGCPTTPSGVVVGAAFSGTSIDSTTGAITNSGGTSNVEVQMTNSSGAAIALNTDANPVNATVSGTGTASLSYEAQYYQPSATAVTAGTVSAPVTYTLTYN